MKKNAEIRNKLKETGTKQWELAHEMGISQCTLVVWLRVELTGERLERVTEALKRIEARRSV